MENVWGLAYNNHNTVPLGRLVGQEDAAERLSLAMGGPECDPFVSRTALPGN